MALLIAQDYISLAFRHCGQMRPGYILPDPMLQEGLTEWGCLFDSWAAERTMGFSIPQYVYPVTGPGSLQGGNGYSVGPIFTFTGTTSIGSAIVTALSNTLGLIAGQVVRGTGIPVGTTILSIDSATQITLSAVATAAGSVTISVIPDFIGPRPESIVRANLVMTNVGPQPVYIPIRMISAEEWAALAIRQIPSINVTSIAYYDPQFPQGVFNVFPPLNGNSIEFFTWSAFATPTSLTQTYSAPPGYQDAVVCSLAERLWPLCTTELMPRRNPQQWMSGRAYEACQKVRTVNRDIPTLRSEAPGSRNQSGGYMDSNVRWVGEPY